jgi:hypothetical protein
MRVGFRKSVLVTIIFAILLVRDVRASSVVCIAPPTCTQDAWQECIVENKCAGPGTIHYSVTYPDGRPGNGDWFIAPCETAHKQSFLGTYTFEPAVMERGSDTKLCIKPRSSK